MITIDTYRLSKNNCLNKVKLKPMQVNMSICNVLKQIRVI